MNKKMNVKEFPTSAVISAITGKLVHNSIDEVYDCFYYMVGKAIYPSEMICVIKDLQVAMIQHLPDIHTLIKESEKINTGNYKDYLDTWIKRYGQTLNYYRRKFA